MKDEWMKWKNPKTVYGVNGLQNLEMDLWE